MKRCFKCGLEKELDEFYAHPSMADGHLGKCKVCARKDTARNAARKSADVGWVIKERARVREKQRRCRASGKAMKSRREVKEAWALRNPVKTRTQHLSNLLCARGILKKPPCCESCGVTTATLHKHHPDYGRPEFVKWVCPKCHGEIHWRMRDAEIMNQ